MVDLLDRIVIGSKGIQTVTLMINLLKFVARFFFFLERSQSNTVAAAAQQRRGRPVASTAPRGTMEDSIEPTLGLELQIRPAKRAKTTADENEAMVVAAPILPPDAWAAVIEYLPLPNVISLSLTFRAIYHDAIPLVTMLHITNAKQMNAAIS